MNFSRYARPYALLTDHRLWHMAARQVAKQLPPSGSQLRLLDAACGAGTMLHDLREQRPDILPIGLDRAWGMVELAKKRLPDSLLGDAFCLPFAANSMDAVLLQRTYYFLPEKSVLLAEMLRVLRPGGRLILLEPALTAPGAWRAARFGIRPLLDMLAWRLAADHIGGFTPQSLAAQLEAAGFARILGESAVEGWGVLARGEKPYATGTSTVDHVAVGASEKAIELLLYGDDLLSVSGKFIHLLITQTPNKPVWQLAPDEIITWGAAAALAPQGQAVALGFSSLPKAVAFMQAAVLAGAITGINKVGKFSKEIAATWDFPVLVNPTLDMLQANYQLKGTLLALDPNSAAAPDE